jgi:hypothetical protein
MPDFMAEMTEKRAMRLPQCQTDLLSTLVIGFGDVHRDQPAPMSRQHAFEGVSSKTQIEEDRDLCS